MGIVAYLGWVWWLIWGGYGGLSGVGMVAYLGINVVRIKTRSHQLFSYQSNPTPPNLTDLLLDLHQKGFPASSLSHQLQGQLHTCSSSPSSSLLASDKMLLSALGVAMVAEKPY